MTTDTIDTGSCPSVFDAGLPTVAYDHLCDPFEAHRIIADARRARLRSEPAVCVVFGSLGSVREPTGWKLSDVWRSDRIRASGATPMNASVGAGRPPMIDAVSVPWASSRTSRCRPCRRSRRPPSRAPAATHSRRCR
jgi:hypothetical protein